MIRLERPLLVQDFHERINPYKELAKNVARKAHAPYSKFHVGSIVFTRNQAFSGCNFENAAFGSTICAERNAIGTMIAEGISQDIVGVLIYTPTLEPAAPCGSCRQVINEFGPDARIISFCDSDLVIDVSLSDLLPYAFGPKNLT